MKKLLLMPILGLLLIPKAYAHCPLCTLGAGAAGGIASYFGVSTSVLGVLIGGFSISMGIWIANMVKKEYFKEQKTVIITLSFLLTVIPLIPMMEGFGSLTINLIGSYGTLLNRTYLINQFVIGSVIGGIVVMLGPEISRYLKSKGKKIPYQGVIITISLLIITSIIAGLVL